jgi:rubredoxin
MKTYKCGWCGYVGPAYGTPFFGGSNSGVSAPWCPRCGINNMLVERTTDAPQEDSGTGEHISQQPHGASPSGNAESTSPIA